MNRAFQEWIIGKNHYIESGNEFRQIMLSAQYGLVSLVVLAAYIFIEVELDSPSVFLVFVGAFFVILASIFLHHYDRHMMANHLLFHTLIFMNFILGSSESLATGAFIFLIPLSLGAFSVFNYAQRHVAFYFSLLSLMLFVWTLFCPLHLLPFRNYSASEMQTYQIINFIIAFPSSVVTVYLLISLSHYNAGKLEEANQQLSRLNLELDRFVYSTSHDLRAPLLSVKGLLAIAESATPEEVVKYHQLMRSRVDSLDSFIRDITEFSRNNRLDIVKQEVNVSHLATDIWESLQYTDEAKRIKFVNNIPKDLLVVNDARRMKVVLTNLLSNAIQYHDRRKEDQYVLLDCEVSDIGFSLRIKDNGQGIPHELQGKIFDMFFRGNASSQGSGLGLYIVKETLAKLSGKILVESAPTQGTTFSISFPTLSL